MKVITASVIFEASIGVKTFKFYNENKKEIDKDLINGLKKEMEKLTENTLQIEKSIRKD